MHSVIIPQRLFASMPLCFLLVLILVLLEHPMPIYSMDHHSTSSSSSSSPLSPSSTGLAGLKEAIEAEAAMEAELLKNVIPHPEDASTNPANHKDKVKYAAGLWLAAAASSGRSSRRAKRSATMSNSFAAAAADNGLGAAASYLNHNTKPWKRRPRILHQSSSSQQQQSENQKHEHHQKAAAAEKDEEPMTAHLKAAGRDMARQMMMQQKQKRRMGNGRMYDVPQIECPRSEDRMERFACPSPDFRGRYRCIDDRSLCDGFFDCPSREDENPDMCLFYKTTKAHLDILAEALLRWARGR